jgi:integrase
MHEYCKLWNSNPTQLLAEEPEVIMDRLNSFFYWLQGEKINGRPKRKASIKGKVKIGKTRISWNSARTALSYIRGFYTHNAVLFPKSFKMPNSRVAKVTKRDDKSDVWEVDDKGNARLNHVLRHFISNLGFRDKTVALCLLSTGADARDLCSLDIDFVLDAKGKISEVDNYFWHSERSKDLVAFKTFMSKEASAMLRLYVEQNRKGAKPNEPIFVKTDGRRLDPKAIQDQFRDAARKMGLMNGKGDAQPFRPKRFRHIFRTACGLSRIDQGMINAMMGHKSDISGSYLSKSKPMFISAYFKIEPLITIYGSDRGGWSELSERLSNLEDKIAMRGQYIDTLEFEIEKLKSTISNLASLVAEKLEDGKA